MNPTTKIRFTEPQIALVMRAHPNCNLDSLTELSFEFDQDGNIVDCIGTIKDGGNIDRDYAGSGLAHLYRAARRRLTAGPSSATILQFPNAAIKSWPCIKTRADALANLPPRARWFPQGDAAIRQRNGSRDRQPSSGQTDGGNFYVEEKGN
jgi:hypothetical protein